MKFNCSFARIKTDECRQIVVTLTDDERAAVERARAANGDEHALLIGRGYALRRAHSELDEHDWTHVEPPAEILLS
jgi:hypothetical protein